MWVCSGDYIRNTLGVEAAIACYERYAGRCFEPDWSLREQQPPDEMNERMFMAPAALYLDCERVEEARRLVEGALAHFEHAPQIAARLARIYHGEGRYEDAVRIADVALRADTGEQSSVSNAAIFETRASAHDALFLRALERGDGPAAIDLAERALNDDAAVLSMPDASAGAYPTKMSIRSNVIAAKLIQLGLSVEAAREVIQPLPRPPVKLLPQGEGEGGAPEGNLQSVVVQVLSRARQIVEAGDDVSGALSRFAADIRSQLPSPAHAPLARHLDQAAGQAAEEDRAFAVTVRGLAAQLRA